MRAPCLHRALTCLALCGPAVAWAGLKDGNNLSYLLLCLLAIAVSAVMVVALFLSLLFSHRSLSKPSFVVGGVVMLTAGIMAALGDELSAWFTGIAGFLVLFITLLVYVGESMLEEAKAKRPSAPDAPRKPSPRNPR